MPYMVLARKYRPQTFEDVVRQDHVTRTLTNAISLGRVAHAILFSGPRGTGKTTVARILAKAMNCKEGPTRIPCNTCRSCEEITGGNAVDVHEIDGASNNSVDQVRELRDNIKYMPAHSPYKIYIIDEVHMLSIAAFNALLKTLEEPPAHVLFFFATTEPQKIPITILSRCQQYDFRRIDMAAIVGHLNHICQKENSDIDAESLTLIAQEAGGSMRDALSLLDQVMACDDGSLDHSRIADILGAVDRQTIYDISGALLGGDVPTILDRVDALHAHGRDLRLLMGKLAEHYRNLLVVKLGKNISKLVDLPPSEIEKMRAQVAGVSAAFLNQVFDYLFDAEVAVKLSSHPKLAVELAFLRLVRMPPTLPIDTLIEKLDQLRREFSGTVHHDSNVHRSPSSASTPVSPSTTAPLKAPSEPASGKPAAPPASASSVPSGDDLWKRLVDAVNRRHPALGPSLAKGSLQSLSDDKLTIAVDGNGFTVKLIKKNLPAVRTVCREILGRDVQVAVEVVKKEKDTDVQKKKEQKEKQKALNHPLVADALEIFDGKIVDVKVQ